MCQSMVDINSVAAEIRRGKKRKIDRKKDRKKLQGKNIMAPLLHRAAIIRKRFYVARWRHKVSSQVLPAGNCLLTCTTVFGYYGGPPIFF